MIVPEPVLVPAPDRLSGHLKSLQTDVLSFYEDVTQHGDFVKVRFFTFWGYILSHPDLAQEVLVKKAKVMHKVPPVVDSVERVVGKNIFSADGEYWKEQRKLMQPAFHSQRIGAYADDMVMLTEKMIQDWSTGDTVAIDTMMADVTMHIIVKTMFSADMDDVLSEFGTAVTDLFGLMGKFVTTIIKAPQWMPTQNNQQLKAIQAKLDQVYDRAIADWRKEGKDRGDLLSMLMLSRYEDGSPMTDDQIKAELGTIFLAGHETTATALTFTWILLSQYPEVAQKLHEEVDRVLQGRTPTLADLKELPYTEKVIKESMRLYPPATGASRTPIEDVEIGGHLIKKGDSVTIPFWIIQRDARWFDDPLTFNPDRWTPEFEAQLPRYAYTPFGAGPRICIGNQFAMLEAELVLATIAQKFSLKLDPSITIQPKFNFTLHPGVEEVTMHVTERQPVPTLS